METLLNQARELNATFNKEIQELKAAKATANTTAAENRVFKNRLEQREADLNSRETALEQSETPVNALVEARRIQSENVALSSKFEQAKSELDNNKRAFASDSSKKQADYNTSMAEVLRERDELKAMREDLKEQKANMKDVILEELKAKL